MSKFVIQGGAPLRGKIRASGMKNAATPIIAATLLTSEECVISNVPKISDVIRMLDILKSLGASVEWTGDHEVTICAKDADIKLLDEKAVKSMRSSILFLGPLLARFKKVAIPEPGGCIIGNRPPDTHFYALGKLGAKITRKDGSFTLEAEGLTGSLIILPEFSVTATENLLMAASLAKGRTEVHLAAAEPHVQDLIKFLNSMGAKISGGGTHTLIIDGVEKLSGPRHTLIPDQIEIGTLAVAAAVSGGEVTIENIIPAHLEIILLKLQEAGVNLEVGKDYLKIKPRKFLRAFRLQTLPYPGFPTDLQAPFGVLATQCQGTTLIQDPLFEGRMGYVGELVKMGANAIVADPHRVVITGPTPLQGQEIKSFDLRAGATLIIAGLIASGETIINEAQVVDRGYEKIEERLNGLGAKIKRVE
ncbi:UDP-N-acetylglucosamine 1-carboxyvinyltransferase [Candidatus Falkowbacteria bacterium]|nr:UDP-N-acetylglucosamine 1-carboxyvinyltransferase [Candidatus Falkowbacteria bacterium]